MKNFTILLHCNKDEIIYNELRTIAYNEYFYIYTYFGFDL